MYKFVDDCLIELNIFFYLLLAHLQVLCFENDVLILMLHSGYLALSLNKSYVNYYFLCFAHH